MGDVTLDLAWHAQTCGADAALAAHLRSVLGPGAVDAGRLCRLCGSDAHGRPWARHEGVLVPVSMSGSGGHLVTVVGSDGPVGLDVESVTAVSSRWDPTLVLAPGETADTDEERARFWSRKEAILKALGTGLARPMTDVRLADHVAEVRDVPAPDGFVAATAELSTSELTVRDTRGTAEVRS